MILHFIILWFVIAILIVLAIFLVDAIGYMYYHRIETVWWVQIMIALVLSLFILGGIVLIAFALESFCSVVGLLQDVSVTASSPK
jgi:type II secretory pathway component PulF